MNKIIQKIIHPKGERGGVLVLVTLCLIILIGFVALAVDIGYMYTTRTELQRVADASALAGARYLGEVYSTLNPSQMAGYAFTPDDVKDAADNTEQNNTAADKSIEIVRDNGDIRVGLWEVTPSDPDPDDIAIETYTGPDAVRVIARRDNIKNGPITTFLAGIFNYDTAEIVSQKAVAALTGPSFVDEGELKLPIGVSPLLPCGLQDINFSPTNTSCAGWHNFFDPISGSAMADKLIGFIRADTSIDPTTDLPWVSQGNLSMIDGETWLNTLYDMNPSQVPDPATTPVTTADEETLFEFQNGEITGLFNGGYLDDATYNGNAGTVLGDDKHPAPIMNLFDYFRYRDGDGDDSIWTATVPVYEDPGPTCLPPNTDLVIIGFSTMIVTDVEAPPNQLFDADYLCDFKVINGRGGGTTYGNLRGTIPNLVR